MEYITMRNGTKVPMLGLGCYKSEEQEGVEAVKSAIEIGYRHIDTANFYENEKYVGRGIRESGIDREKLFVVSKIWPTSFKTPEVAIEYSMSPSDRRICRSYETDDTGRFYSSYYNGSYLYCDSNRRGGNDFIFFMQ